MSIVTFRSFDLKTRGYRWQNTQMAGFGIVVLLWVAFFCYNAHAEVIVDLDFIKTIESGRDIFAVNYETGCYGLYQISAICLKDFNQMHNSHYTINNLFDPGINEKIASWYFKRIKEMLATYDIPVTVTTLIVSYNWGMGHVRQWYAKGMQFSGLPAETRSYIKRYTELTHLR